MSAAQIKSTDTLQSHGGCAILRYLRDRWFLAAGALAIIVAAAVSWNWLVTAGIASILVSVLPCLVMCGLSLCTHKFIGNSGNTAVRLVTSDSQEASSTDEGNQTPLHVASCCGAGSFGNPANAPARGVPEKKETTNA